MNQSSSNFWYVARVFVLRSYALWLILVFLFISNFLQTYHFKAFLNEVLFCVTRSLLHAAGYFVHAKQIPGNVQFRDYYWTFVALFLYLLMALIGSLVWTIRDKGKKASQFFNYTRIFARYYLAAILLGYGISKLLGDQFSQPDFASLIRPLGDFDARNLFWEFMGASKSYQIFGGILETLAGLLLLFRRTTTLGALIAFSLFINVLMLDIGYDVFVKVRVIYFLLVNILILIPDLRNLFAILVLKQSARLSSDLPVIKNKKYKWVYYGAKAGFIALIILVIVRKQSEVYAEYHHPSQGSISGIYVVDQFYVNHQLRQTGHNDAVSWRKIAINNTFPILSIKLMNDSITDYAFKADTVKQLIDLIPYNKTGNKVRLHYKNMGANEWVFEGTLNKDSIMVISKKLSNKSFTLQKGYGKSRWNFDEDE